MNKLHYTSRSKFIILIFRIFIAMLLMQLCRCIYYLHNYDAFSHLTVHELYRVFIGGLLFDGASVAYTNALFFFLFLMGSYLPLKWENSKIYRFLVGFTYIVPNILNLFVNISDAVYYPFVLKRTTLSVFSEFQNENVFKMYMRFATTYWQMTLAFIGLVIILIASYTLVKYKSHDRRYIIHYISPVIQIALLTLLSLYCIRGDLNIYNNPMSMAKAQDFVKDQKDCSLVLNTTYCLIRTANRAPLEELHFYDQSELKQHFSPYYQAQPLSPTDSLWGHYKDHNIVLLILESFDREYIGSLNTEIPNYPTYTPFIDSLIQESCTFKYSYANGRISMQAMPSALSSLPSLDLIFVLSHYANNQLIGLPKILGDKGYSTSFYHGAPDGSMGFESFTKKVGSQHYFSMQDHNNDADYDGAWGIYDEPFLQSVAADIDNGKKPFFSTIFTLSSHEPYHVPEKYKGRFKDGTLPIHKAVRYSDYAVKQFFHTMQAKPWFDNTLFIIMADHASLSDRPEYNNIAGKFSIPIIFYDPQGYIKGLQTDYVAQQADILPSLLYLTGDSTKVVSYGHNLFDPLSPHYAVNYLDNTFYLIDKTHTVAMDINGDAQLLPPSQYVQIEKDSIQPMDSVPYQQSVDLLKAILQDYNYRIIHDQLVVKQQE